MLHITFKKIRRFVTWLAAILVLLWILLSGVEFLAEFYLVKHSNQLVNWASKVMEQPIKVSAVSIGRVDLEPVLVFHDVEILTNEGKAGKVLAKAKQLDLGFDMVRSILTMQVIPSIIVVTDASIDLYENKDGSVTLGKPLVTDAKAAQQNVRFADLLEWFCTQEHIVFSRTSVNWHDVYGDLAIFSLQRLDLSTAHGLPGQLFAENFAADKARFFSAVKFQLSWANDALQLVSGHTGKWPIANWLQTVFTEANHVSGKLQLYHPLAKSEVVLPFLMEANLYCQRFKFNHDWPELSELDAHVLFDGKSVIITTNAAKILQRSTERLTARIDDVKKPLLVIDGLIYADMQDGIKLVSQSPLQPTVGESLQGIDLSGPLNLQLHLQIPLDKQLAKKMPVKVLGKIVLVNNGLLVRDWQIPVSNLNGELDFTHDGISAKSLAATLFSHPIAIDASTVLLGDSNNFTQIIINNGILGVKEFAQKFALPLDKITGDLSYQAVLKLYHPSSRFNNVLNLTSDLKGVALDWPAPLSKIAAETKAFNFILNFKQDHIQQAIIHYGKELTIGFDSEATTAVQQSSKPHALVSKLMSTRALLTVTGNFAEFDWDHWNQYLLGYFAPDFSTKYLRKIIPSKVAVAPRLVLHKLALQVGLLHVWGQTLLNAGVVFLNHPEHNVFTLDLVSKNIKGQLTIPKSYPGDPIFANFSYLNLSGDGKKTVAKIKPYQVPYINLVCNDFSYMDKKLGALHLNLVPGKTAVSIQKLAIYNHDVNFVASGLWQVLPQGQNTSLRGQVQSSNWGNFLMHKGWGDNLVGGVGAVNFTLTWPDIFYNIKFDNLLGKIKLQVKNGQIINLDQQTEAGLGIGRFLSLFSLQSLPRRLTLDFSDVTKKGFLFDDMVGDFKLDLGNLYTNNAYLNGPIAKVIIKGRIGILQKDYDLKLLTFPHTMSSLPVIAAVAGGPIAGVATWLASNFFSYEVKKATNYIYAVTGSWHDPKFIKTAIPVSDEDAKPQTPHKFN